MVHLLLKYLSYVKKYNRERSRFNFYKADIDKLYYVLNSVRWDEALRDFHNKIAWKCFEIKPLSNKQIIYGEDTPDHNLALII